MDLGLAGAACVVSGGSKGMGRAAAEALAAEGARVAVLARTQSAIDETVTALLTLGAQDAVGLSADLTDGPSIAGAFDQLGERWGELNVLVNAAGPVEVGVGRFDAIDDAEWAATFDIGTISAVRCVRAALPLLRQAEWARIVNVSGTRPSVNRPTLSPTPQPKRRSPA
jgi:3-oxoacyl-[acyl-carrier protein] reductase